MIDDRYEDILGENKPNSEDIDKKEESVNEEKIEERSNFENVQTPSFNIDVEVERHIKNAFSLLRERKLQEAKIELDEAYNLDENNPYIYLGKVLLKYNFKCIEDLEKTANIQVVTDNFFKAGIELAEGKLRTRLKKIVDDVNFNYSESNLSKANLEELLFHLKIQEEKKLDYTYTISLILGLLYRNFRYFDRRYIDNNFLSDIFLTEIRTYDKNFNYYLEILYRYSYIRDINDIIQRIISEHNDVYGYVLVLFYREVPSITSKEELLKIKDYLEVTYINHEADEIIYLINEKCRSGSKGSKKVAIVLCSTIAGILLLAGVGTGVGLYVYDQSATVDGMYFRKNNSGGFTLTSISSDVGDTITFPDSVRNLPITEISSTAFKGKNIKSIESFPNDITSIPDNAFEGCKYLEEFTFERNSTLTSIGEEAFKDCIVLNDFVIPSTVSKIGQNAFENTPELTDLTNNSSVDFDGEYCGLTPRYCSYTYYENNEEKEGVKQYYSWDKTITLPVGSKTNYEFGGYEDKNGNLLNYSVSSDSSECTVIVNNGEEMNLTAKYITTSTYIKNGVTYTRNLDDSSYSVTDFDYEEFLTATGTTGKQDLTIEDSINGYLVTNIASNAFKDDTNLLKVSLPYGLKTIEKNAFIGAIKLQTISFNTLPSDKSVTSYSLSSIGESAFESCTALTTFTLEGLSTIEIESDAFKNCTALTSMTNNTGKEFSVSECSTMGLSAKTVRVYNRESSTDIVASDGYTSESYYLLIDTIIVTNYSSTTDNERVVFSYDLKTYEEATTDRNGVVLDVSSSPAMIYVDYERSLTSSEKEAITEDCITYSYAAEVGNALSITPEFEMPTSVGDDNKFDIDITLTSYDQDLFTFITTSDQYEFSFTENNTSKYDFIYDEKNATQDSLKSEITFTVTIKSKLTATVEKTTTKSLYIYYKEKASS